MACVSALFVYHRA